MEGGPLGLTASGGAFDKPILPQAILGVGATLQAAPINTCVNRIYITTPRDDTSVASQLSLIFGRNNTVFNSLPHFRGHLVRRDGQARPSEGEGPAENTPEDPE